MQDDWTPLQFDAAVLYFGTYVENKLSERTSDGKPLYTLAQIIGDKEEKKSSIIANLAAMFGLIER